MLKCVSNKPCSHREKCSRKKKKMQIESVLNKKSNLRDKKRKIKNCKRKNNVRLKEQRNTRKCCRLRGIIG